MHAARMNVHGRPWQCLARVCVCVRLWLGDGNEQYVNYISSISIDKSREVFDHWRCHQTAKTLCSISIRPICHQQFTSFACRFSHDFVSVFSFLLLLSPLIRFGRIHFYWRKLRAMVINSLQRWRRQKKKMKSKCRWMNNENNRDADRW